MSSPSLPFLKASEALWKRRHTWRQRRYQLWAERESKAYRHWRELVAERDTGDAHRVAAYDDYATAREHRVRWSRLRDQASYWLRRRRQQILNHGGRPQIVTSDELRLRFDYPWGGKGHIVRGAGHYTAGRRCRNDDDLRSEMRAIHSQHHRQGWGGLSYEALVADDGTIGFGNPVDRKSAAVAYTNTGMVNICCPGSTGDRMTPQQRQSIRWLLDNWHTSRVPKRWRLPRPARELDWRGHREWPRNATACPGDMLADYKELW